MLTITPSGMSGMTLRRRQLKAAEMATRKRMAAKMDYQTRREHLLMKVQGKAFPKNGKMSVSASRRTWRQCPVIRGLWRAACSSSFGNSIGKSMITVHFWKNSLLWAKLWRSMTMNSIIFSIPTASSFSRICRSSNRWNIKKSSAFVILLSR